ncbi:hypothetical protein G6F42_011696 [Rhizopus arrhizus]|nr:hypothetical protein G6F42_011696 [Rhizopus arrhizus]
MSSYYHRQQQPNGSPMLNQQPILHQPPVVYGNYNMSASPQYAMYPYYHYQPNTDLMKSSPISMASSTENECPRTPPTAINHTTGSTQLTSVPQGTTPSLMVNPLVPPPPPPPLSSSPLVQQLKSTEDRVKETIARANALPLELYQTEFLEYSTQQLSANRKRKRITAVAATDNEQETNKRYTKDQDARLSNDELRRQIHIQSEQKRRAQIKDGFEELKQHLPGCSQKKLSKAALLTRTVQQLEHMKKMQNELLAEVERLVKENSSLKKFAAAVDTHM